MSSTYDGERTRENIGEHKFGPYPYMCIRLKFFEDSFYGETNLDATLPLKQPQRVQRNHSEPL